MTTVVEEVQARYAKRIKARLAQPKIDMASARDGILDCYVSTYFGGLKMGISGYLGIDASEEQVAHIAQNLFRKRLREHGSSFENPSVEALDRVKQEVDEELHFDELPAEIQGLHDQVCSLMLSKAEGQLEHTGDRSAVSSPAPARSSAPAPASAAPASAAPAAPVAAAPISRPAPAPRSAPPRSAPPRSAAPRPAAPRAVSPEAASSTRSTAAHAAPKATPAAVAPTMPRRSTSIEAGLRDALATYLSELADSVRAGASMEEVRAAQSKVGRLIDVVADFG